MSTGLIKDRVEKCKIVRFDEGNIARGKAIVVLKPYEEIAGRLIFIEDYQGMLVAKLSDIRVVLPLGTKDELSEFLGRHVAIIRTDIPNREYIIRLISGSNGATKEDDILQNVCNGSR
jgi:hypothetical protein